jgi:glycosyltransferase involved in cell wall biosynthesis
MIHELQTGGTERQFSLLARTLSRERYRVEAGCLRRRGAFLEGLEHVSEFPLGGSFFSRQAWRAHRALKQHLQASGVSITHSFDLYSNLLLIPTARAAGVPIVIGSQRQLGDLLSPGKRRALRLVFRLCDRVVCNSLAAAERLIHEGLPQRKVVVIPNALPEESFADVPAALPPNPGVVRVGLIARMNNPVKNQSLFLRAAAKLTRDAPQIEFLLVGDGRLRCDLERLAHELGLGENVRFLGERRDISAVLASIDISVVASRSESQSNVILESMAAGKPVVASRVGGNRELIREGETGLLFAPDDDAALSKAIARLLEDRALRLQYGARAKKFAHTHFRLENIREHYEQLYATLLEEKCGEKGTTIPVPGRSQAKPLRVAIVAPSTRILGGQSVQASLLCRSWQSDAEVEASLIPVDPDLPRAISWLERVPYLRTAVRMPFYLWSLWRGLRGADVAHIFSASYWSFLLAPAPALLVARMRGVKALINYRSGEAREHLGKWRTARPILRRADRLVVPSRYLKDVFQGFGLAAEIVPNVVDLSQFSFRARNPLQPRLVCTRGFEPYYDVDVVVRAFARVKQEFPDARLCLVGKGTLEPRIRALVHELGLPDVEFAGAVARDHIGRYYDQNDIFINASWLDNMPVSVLEAFAAGTLVVSTAADGIRYIVEHERTGLLSPPKDWAALAQNVIRLLRHPELAGRLATEAYQESQRYHWEAVRGQWLHVYCSLRLHQGTADSVSPLTPEHRLAASKASESIPGQGTSERTC